MKSSEAESSAEKFLASSQFGPDFNFWVVAQTQVYMEKPDTIESLIQCVQTFAEGYSQETIKNVCKNVLKRVSLCLKVGGGHFQQLL